MNSFPAKPRKPWAIFAITKHGVSIGARLLESLPDAELWVSAKFLNIAPAGSRTLPLPFGPMLRENFADYDCHIFIISVGAVVRMIAPLLVSKKTDPAVICIDDAAQFAICLLSGHVGRGNVFTERVATILDAQPVITTASDVRGTLQVDILGRNLGWSLADSDFNVTRGCAAVVNEERVAFIQEAGEPDWWPQPQALPPGVQYYTSLDEVEPQDFSMLLIASDRELQRSHPQHHANAVTYRPKSLVLGIGCDRGTPVELLERGMIKILAEQQLAVASVGAIASIDLKQDEAGLIALAARYGWDFKYYKATELDAVSGIESPSAMVHKHVGTRGVAEPAALIAAGAEALLVPKQKYKEEGTPFNMTLAVARIPQLRRLPHAAQENAIESRS